MNGTKKFPHIITNENTVTTATPGPISGSTIRTSD